jgi:hypothetical protein
MSDKGTWGGNVELQAASLALEINITVHQLDQPRWQIINFPGNDLLGGGVQMIHLSYHDGQHYNSLVPNNPQLISKVSNPAKSSSSTSSSSSKPTNSRKTTKSGINMTQEENMVSIAMKSSNFTNREMVLGVLRDYEYDLDSTIEALICMKNLDNENSHPESNNNDVDYHSSSSSSSSTNGTTSTTSKTFPEIVPTILDTSSYGFSSLLPTTPSTTTNGMAIPSLSSLPASISDIIHAELTTLMSKVSNYTLSPSTSLDGSGFICPPMNDDEALAASLYESEILAASLASLGKQTSSSSSSTHSQKGQEKVPPVQEKPPKYQGNNKTKNQPQKHLSNKQRKELRKQEQSVDQRKEMKRLELQQLLEQVRQEEGEEVAQRLAVDLGAMMI